ncbi:MAG TPA: hypothetical protein VNU92_09565 [Edaphobacter sp.]|nr:hypothetical protein [Edaphobacter sp.]
MSEIGHSGFSQGAWTAQSHEEFRELCALSTTDELTAEEWSRLEEHLSICHQCRELKRGYERVVATTVPVLATDSVLEEGDEGSSESWSLEEAEKVLMASLRNEPAPFRSVQAKPPKAHKWNFAYGYYAAAALVLIFFTFAGYRAGVYRERRLGSEGIQRASVGSNSSPGTDQTQVETIQANPKNERGDSNILELRDQTRLDLEQIRGLKEMRSQLEAEVAKQSADLDRSSQDRISLDQQLAVAQSEEQILEEQLAIAKDQKSANTTQLAALEARVNDLSATLQAKDQEIAKEQELLKHDRDIRDLIGARDLYIAEIYDVARTGDTQKPFGRVFYTKDKSLIFYGYDLDQQQGIRNASTFQAWGRSGPDENHVVSLGFLYQDDANKKRWVLKSSDATTLARLDAVFVTVEPPGGSTKPSGKPLLFTYLRLGPNHP